MIVLTLLSIAFATPTVAIADLANHTGDSRFDGAGPGVAGILVSRFQGSGAVQVVERRALEVLLVEQQLTVDGLTDPRTAARAGRLLGADWLIVGELFSVQLPTVSIALRVVDTQTGEVRLARDVIGEVGERGERFFELIDQLSTEILGALDVSLPPGRALSDVTQRELDAVLRYGEDLLRVNLDHPRSLYRESDRDFDRDATVRRGWTVVDKRGIEVAMPEFARRVGDRETQRAFLERGRTDRRSARLTNLVTGGYGIVGFGLFAGGGQVGDGDGDPETPSALQGVGLAVLGTSAVHLVANAIGQAGKRAARRRPSTYYAPADADRWIQLHNRSLTEDR